MQFNYSATPRLDDDNRLTDVLLNVDGKIWHLAGRGGPEQESRLLSPLERRTDEPPCLPVLLGSGLGAALAELLRRHDGPVAVVDAERPILDVTHLEERFAADRRLCWIMEPDPGTALKALTVWQMENGGHPMVPLINPVYQRLNREMYAFLKDSLAASSRYDFWAKTRYPKFQNAKPRILLVTSQYFLMGELVEACRRLDVPHHFIDLGEREIGSVEFVEKLLTAVIEFKPDFVFTLNHLGVDREGVLAGLLERLNLPLASWFVDNPHLILYLYSKVITPGTAIFTWDTDNISSLRELGFDNVFYLPLATDQRRFAPPPGRSEELAQVSFVGNSMQYKVGHRLKTSRPNRELLLRYREVAGAFGEHGERSVGAFLQNDFPGLMPHFERLDTPERRLAFEAMITWEATRQYRKRCLEQTLPFNPLIVGDRGWRITFKRSPHPWRWHPEMNYYNELPGFYPRCAINFNCTSKQMKGAVNQRVFDVPATGSFVLTDWREQIENLFEPEKEVICFHQPEEAGELIRRYLAHPGERTAVAEAARKRILAKHTYEHRLLTIMRVMRETFA